MWCSLFVITKWCIYPSSQEYTDFNYRLLSLPFAEKRNTGRRKKIEWSDTKSLCFTKNLLHGYITLFNPRDNKSLFQIIFITHGRQYNFIWQNKNANEVSFCPFMIVYSLLPLFFPTSALIETVPVYTRMNVFHVTLFVKV